MRWPWINMADAGSINVGGSLDYDNIVDCIKTIRSQNAEPNGWVISSANDNVLAQLKVNGEANHYVGTLPGDIPRLTKVTTEGIGDGDVLVGDFAQAIMGLRQAARVEVSSDSSFERHSIDIKTTSRVDFATMHQQAFCVATSIS